MKKENREVAEDLLKEATDILLRMEKLGKKVDKEYKEVMRCVNEYPDEEWEKLGYGEVEEHEKRVEDLWKRLGKSVEELQTINCLYEEIRGKVQKKYGKDIMGGGTRGFTLPMEKESIDLVGGGEYE